MHIAIAGNIGSGKTTLCTLLANRYGWTPRFEPVKENPYLSDFYADIARWSFNLEVFFLKERFRDALEIAREKAPIVQDRTIWEGVHVFVENNFRQGNMEPRDYETFMDLFSQMEGQLPLPDLMVFLRAPVDQLIANIHKRGRDYEQQMPREYLAGISALYEDFVAHKYQGRVLPIDVTGKDFLCHQEDFAEVLSQIEGALGRPMRLDSK